MGRFQLSKRDLPEHDLRIPQVAAIGRPDHLLQIRIAIDCGFGQLGKHGSLISKQHGSNFRLGCMVTDLPLAAGTRRVDIGVDDLCGRCGVCVRD